MRANNILSNSDLETGNLSGWTIYGANCQVNSGAAHSGSYYFKVYQAFNGQINYNGIYQDSVSVPGAEYSADGWAYTLSSDALAGQNVAWIEVTFRDASGTVLALYRSSLIMTNTIADGTFPKNTWVDLPITNQYDPGSYEITNTAATLVAPAGTSFVRYQIMFQGDQYYSAGSIYFDDLTLNQTGGATIPVRQWNIVWNDEFNGNSIDRSKWNFETGNNNGWGNSEREYYTGRTNNAYVNQGFLHIIARQESTNSFSYTSARMKTENLYTTTYGRVEWRAAMPAGTGMWPALWMLGANINSVGWPGCGEMDVMEENGSATSKIQSSLHSGTDETGFYNFPVGDSATNFHTYLLDWEPDSISFLIDGHLYETQTSWGSSVNGATYPTPFNAPFFLVMNLAVGGNYVGNPSISDINGGTVFPAEMKVDYVRVYEQTAPLEISMAQSNGNIALSWPTNIICHLQMETNSLTVTNWVDISAVTNPFIVTPDRDNNEVFFRLQSP